MIFLLIIYVLSWPFLTADVQFTNPCPSVDPPLTLSTNVFNQLVDRAIHWIFSKQSSITINQSITLLPNISVSDIYVDNLDKIGRVCSANLTSTDSLGCNQRGLTLNACFGLKEIRIQITIKTLIPRFEHSRYMITLPLVTTNMTVNLFATDQTNSDSNTTNHRQVIYISRMETKAFGLIKFSVVQGNIWQKLFSSTITFVIDVVSSALLKSVDLYVMKFVNEELRNFHIDPLSILQSKQTLQTQNSTKDQNSEEQLQKRVASEPPIKHRESTENLFSSACLLANPPLTLATGSLDQLIDTAMRQMFLPYPKLLLEQTILFTQNINVSKIIIHNLDKTRRACSIQLTSADSLGCSGFTLNACFRVEELRIEATIETILPGFKIGRYAITVPSATIFMTVELFSKERMNSESFVGQLSEVLRVVDLKTQLSNNLQIEAVNGNLIQRTITFTTYMLLKLLSTPLLKLTDLYVMKMINDKLHNLYISPLLIQKTKSALPTSTTQQKRKQKENKNLEDDQAQKVVPDKLFTVPSDQQNLKSIPMHNSATLPCGTSAEEKREKK